jgi:hypothetical protein
MDRRPPDAAGSETGDAPRGAWGDLYADGKEDWRDEVLGYGLLGEWLQSRQAPTTAPITSDASDGLPAWLVLGAAALTCLCVLIGR